jgi:hypothetical protein
MKKTNIILVGTAALLTFASGANAQLETYFNLQDYGNVSAGQTIIDQTENTSATLNNDASTSMTSSGLIISAPSFAGNAASTGLTFASGSLSSFTGSFSIEDWVTPAGGTGVVLFGGNSGPINGWYGDGYTGVSSLTGFNWGSLVSGGGSGNPLNQGYDQWGNTVAGYSLAPGQTYDLMLTYNASTYTFNQYINGSWIGSLQEAFSSTSLAGVQVFAIGGAVNEPWAAGSPIWYADSDDTAPSTTEDFLLYSNELSASQVAAEDALGAGASLNAVEAAAVPEPSTCAMFIGGLGLVFRAARRRLQV